MSLVANSTPTTTLRVDRERLLFVPTPPVLQAATHIAPPIDEQLDLYHRVAERLETPGQTLSAERVMRALDEG